MRSFNPQNWYWIVNGSTTQVYSSLRGEYITLPDADYTAWLEGGQAATKIDSDASLQAVLYQANALNLSITSTSTPTLNGVYSIGQQSQNDITAVQLYIVTNGKFPQGQATTYWADKSGEIHQFPSIDVFKAFATAVADFVDALEDYINSGGEVGSVPSNQVTII